MSIDRENKKKEARSRMEILKLHPDAIKEFWDEDKLNLSFCGNLSWLNDVQKEKVQEFEKRNNSLVYHVIYDYTAFGKMLTLLYVSDYPEEWEQDRADLKDGYPLAYVANLDDNLLSEFGMVGVKPHDGGVLRIA